MELDLEESYSEAMGGHLIEEQSVLSSSMAGASYPQYSPLSLADQPALRHFHHGVDHTHFSPPGQLSSVVSDMLIGDAESYLHTSRMSCWQCLVRTIRSDTGGLWFSKMQDPLLYRILVPSIICRRTLGACSLWTVFLKEGK